MKPEESWETQRERSTVFWVGVLAWIVQRLGRSIARLVLWPIVLYFLLTASAARRASRDFLERALARKPRISDIARHFFQFAACSIDRLLLPTDQGQQLRLHVHRSPAIDDLLANGRSGLVLVSHLGSFEVLRVIGADLHAMPLKIVLDRQHGRIVTSLIEKLDPAFASSIIDASQRGPTLALAMHEALRKGFSLGIMADRVRADEPSIAVQFLGDTAWLPSSPWIMASILKVPVIVAFGVYRGGADYDAHFELLTDAIDVPRADRPAVLQELAQRYADRLEHHARQAPFNWFNFYDYWQRQS